MSVTSSALMARTVTPLMDCLIWVGETNDGGYGRVVIDGKRWRAHRLAWELKNGPIPEGLEIDHLCRVRACINTAHLELVTHAENLARRPEWASLTHCSKGHEYPADRPMGTRRRCLTCLEATRFRETLRKREVRRVAREATSASP